MQNIVSLLANNASDTQGAIFLLGGHSCTLLVLRLTQYYRKTIKVDIAKCNTYTRNCGPNSINGCTSHAKPNLAETPMKKGGGIE